MRTATLKIEGMHCQGCVKSVRSALERLADVRLVDVSIGKAVVELQSDKVPDRLLLEALADAGFDAAVSP